MTPLAVMQVVLSLRVGGLERVVVDLVGHASPDIRFVICCLESVDPAARLPAPARARVVCLDKRPGWQWRLPGRIAALVRQEHIQVVHTHNATAHVYGALGARWAGARVLHTEHGKNLGDERRSWRLNRWVAPFTDLTAAVSEKVAREAAAHEGVPPDRLRVVPNGIPIERFASPVDRTALRRTLGLPATAVLVGSVGRLVPEKNYPLLLSAFARLAAVRTDIHLVFAGDGPRRTDLEREAAVRGLAPRVLFLGTSNEVPALLGSLDAFALSSDTEGMPMALLEAMAAGCPIVVTAVGSNAQVITHGQQGLVVPPRDEPALADAIARLLDDRAAAAHFGRAARARVAERYSVQTMTRAYEELWRELARGNLKPDT